jgi:hypothetical protein
MRRTLLALATTALAALPLGLAQNVELLGAGATFPAPLITAMADEYRDVTGGRVTVNYQSIGSGGGIRQFTEQTVMFGMSEAFLNDAQLAAIADAGGGIAFNIPITLGDVVPTYNLPGRADRPGLRRRHARGDLPRQHHAPGPTRRSRCSTPACACRRSPSPSCTAPTARAPRTSGPAT